MLYPADKGTYRVFEKHRLLPKILGLIKEEISLDRVKLFLVNENREVVYCLSQGPSSAEEEDINHEIFKRIFDERQPLIVNSAPPSLGLKPARRRSILSLPLLIGGKLSGILCLQRKDGFQPFLNQDLELLIALSEPIIWILKNQMQFRALDEREINISKPFFGGRSKAFRNILSLIDRVKDCDVPVFICGESGTGKELVARAIHNRGARRGGKFVAINCGAMPESLLESELFGYVRGAFTGAVKDKPGLIEEANGGTFFLDEIGDLSPNLQAKLLRLLQEKEIRRIGENKILSVNGRFISATNKNIEKEVECGLFRQDLYYRLKIFTIEIPPLRDRREDILFLLDYFLQKYCQEQGRKRAYLSPEALELLLSYHWPGNVRELQNELMRCLVFVGEDNLIRAEQLSLRINPQKEKSSSSFPNFFNARAQFEKRFISQALIRWSFNKVKTAREIGLSRQGLFKLIKKHRIEVRK